MSTLRLWCVACLVGLASCGDDDCCALDAGDPTVRKEVASIAVTPNRDIDLLFMVDDSSTTYDKQVSLKAAFPAFIDVLNRTQGGFPNVHIGVVTSDLGMRSSMDPMSGPPIGNGPGSCSGTGKAGALQTSTTVSGAYITDVANSTGRMTNYTGTLAEAFSAIASVGAMGCGFEQPIEAVKVALDNNPANAGFLRANANLAIIFLTDEDDCSMAHWSLTGSNPSLGELNSFRCTRFGVTCDVGGTTTDEMNVVGVKSGCHSNESATYLTQIDAYPAWFEALKQRASMLMVAALAGPRIPVEVELRAPPGGITPPVPALKHACEYMTAASMSVSDPAVRLAQLVDHFARGSFEDLCMEDLTSQITRIAYGVRGMVGDTCLVRSIVMPASCVATDENGAGTTNLPMCGGSQTTNCFQLVSDPVACTEFDHLRVDIVRSEPAPADTVTSVRCVVP